MTLIAGLAGAAVVIATAGLWMFRRAPRVDRSDRAQDIHWGDLPPDQTAR